MRPPHTFFGRHKRTIFALLFVVLFAGTVAYAVPPGSPYNPGETLDPGCAPGDSNCSVRILPSQTGNGGKYLTTDGTSTSWVTAASGGTWGSITGTLSSQTDLQSALNAKEAALTFSTGVTRIANTITSNLSTGVAGGQSVIGGTASGENLTLSSTSNGTKGKIAFGTSAYDEANNRLGIGTTSPASALDVAGTVTVSTLTGAGNRLLQAGATGDIGASAVDPQEVTDVFVITGAQNTLISGGVVSWVSGLTFDVSAADYYIQGDRYSAPATQVTLSAADSNFDRIDVFAVDANGSVVVIEGTPSATPTEPEIDSTQYLRLSFAYIPATATAPQNVANEFIYQENAEWATSTNQPSVVNFNYATAPHAGSKSVRFSQWLSGTQATFVRSSSTTLTGTTLVFYIKTSAAWGSNSRKLSLQWLTGSTAASNSITMRDGNFGFSESNTGWQKIAIPISQWTLSGTSADRLRITVGNNSTASFSLQFDDIELQNGVTNTAPTQNTFLTVQGDTGIYSAQTTKDTLRILGSNSISTSLSSNAITMALAGDTATPGNTKYYGTNGSGAKGWYSLSTSTPGLQDVITQDGAISGDQTISVTSGGRLIDTIGANGSFTLDGTDNSNHAVLVMLNDGAGTSLAYQYYPSGMSYIQQTATNTQYFQFGASGLDFHSSMNGYLYGDGNEIGIGGLLYLDVGTPCAGCVLTDVNGDGYATWQAPSGAASHFGISGEDDTASADRAFTIGSHVFDFLGSQSPSYTEIGNDFYAQSGPDFSNYAHFHVSGSSASYANNGATIRVVYAGATSDYHFRQKSFDMTAQSVSPSTPMTGEGSLYPKTDGKLYYKNDTGTEYDLTASGGTSGIDDVLAAGQSLTTARSITQGTNRLTVTGSGTSNSTSNLLVSGTGFNGLAMEITSEGRALLITGSSAGHNALTVQGQGSGFAAEIRAVSGLPLYLWAQPSTTNTIHTTLQLSRFSSGTAASGIGQAIDFYNQNSTGSGVGSNTIISKFTNVSSGSETSQFILKGRNSGTFADLLTLNGNGQLALNKYGVNSFTGTAAYNLAVDSSGNVIEVAAGSGGTPTLQQVLTSGSTATTANTITSSGYNFKIQNLSGDSSYIKLDNTGSAYETFATINPADFQISSADLSYNTQTVIEAAGGSGAVYLYVSDSLNSLRHNLYIYKDQILINGGGNTLNFKLQGLPSTSTSNVLYYNSSTGALSYGAAGASLIGSTSSSGNNETWLGTSSLGTASKAFTVFIGVNAGLNATSASSSNFIGWQAGDGATSAFASQFIGVNAGLNAASASNSNFIGGTAGREATNANDSNFIGDTTGYQATNADNSNFMGQYAGYQATNARNSNFFGYQSGALAASASYSVFLGYNSGYSATNAKNSIFIGQYAGDSDTVNNTTNSNDYSILIGANTSTGGFKNSIALGASAVNTASNEFMIGSTTRPIDSTRINGSSSTQCTITTGTGIACTSDERLKTNIIVLPSDILEQLTTLKTVKFNWLADPNGPTQIGFIAQNLEEVFPELVATNEEGYKSVYYSQMTPILVEAVKEIDVKLKDINDFESTADDSFVGKLRAWLANATNRITRIFTGEICLTDPDGSSECLNKVQLTELKHLINNSAAQSTPPVEPAPTEQAPSDSTPPADTTTPDSTQTPSADQTPSPEQQPEPAPADITPAPTETEPAPADTSEPAPSSDETPAL